MRTAGFKPVIPANKTHALDRTATSVAVYGKSLCLLQEYYGIISRSMDRKQALTGCEGSASLTVITLLSWLMTVMQFMFSYHGFSCTIFMLLSTQTAMEIKDVLPPSAGQTNTE